jgi:solute carrier family 25 phosphate transporter 23/24/25/41
MTSTLEPEEKTSLLSSSSVSSSQQEQQLSLSSSSSSLLHHQQQQQQQQRGKDQQEETATTKKKVGTATSLLAGFLAGMISRTATAPLDRIKVMSQEGRVHLPPKKHPTLHVVEKKVKPSSFRQIALHIYRDGGMPAFWRGNGSNCIKASLELSLLFGFRTAFMQQCEPWTAGQCDLLPARWFSEETQHADPPPWYYYEMRLSHRKIAANFVTSAAAGAAAQLIVYPLETTKTRIAVATSGEYAGILDCMQQSIKRGGVRDLYKGLVANLAGIVPYRGLEIGCFFSLQNQLLASRRATWTKHHNMASEREVLPDRRAEHERIMSTALRDFETTTAFEVAAIGMVASVLAQTATYPLNLVRTRLQTQGVNGREARYHSMRHCISSVYARDGAAGFFRGYTSNLYKAVPASALTFMVVDKVTNLATTS